MSQLTPHVHIQKNTNGVDIKHLTLYTVCICLIICILGNVFRVYADTHINQTSTSSPAVSVGTSSPYTVDESRIRGTTILVKDITNDRVLYERNANEIVPLASLSKLITAITVREMQKSWKGIPNQIRLMRIGIAQNTADRQVRTGGYLTVDDAISYMLLTSSNFAAESLARQIIPYNAFISYMNFIARKSGAKSIQVINPTGLTEISRGGIHRNPVGTAYDISHILSTIYKSYPELMEVTVKEHASLVKNSTRERIVLDNTNTALNEIPDIILGKTGFTDDAGGNLALLVKRNDTVYSIIIMNSTRTDRFLDAIYLASQI